MTANRDTGKSQKFEARDNLILKFKFEGQGLNRDVCLRRQYELTSEPELSR